MTIVVFGFPYFNSIFVTALMIIFVKRYNFCKVLNQDYQNRVGLFIYPFVRGFSVFFIFSAVVYIRLSGFLRFLPFFRFLMGINVSLLLVTGQKGR